MNKHTSLEEIIHPFREGEHERKFNSVSKEQYLIEREKQLVQQKQFLKIMTLSFHNFLIKSYRNLLQNSESDSSECCHFEQDLRQAILDHESKLALYFDSDITKSLGLRAGEPNRLTGT